MHIVTIAHSLIRPWNINVPVVDVSPVSGRLAPLAKDLLPKARTFATVGFVSIGARRVELSILMDVERDVENIWVIVERFLDSISCEYMSVRPEPFGNNLEHTVMDIPEV